MIALSLTLNIFCIVCKQIIVWVILLLVWYCLSHKQYLTFSTYYFLLAGGGNTGGEVSFALILWTPSHLSFKPEQFDFKHIRCKVCYLFLPFITIPRDKKV